MLAARHSVQQAASLSSLPAQILNRIVGKFSQGEDYTPHVNLEMENRYVLPLNKMFSRTGDLERRLERDGMVGPQYTEHLTFNGSTHGEVEAARISNGVTAVSVDSASSVVHLGVYLGIGTRDETRATAGMLHVMKNAWLGTTTRRTFIAGHREPAQCGSTINMSVGRDQIAITSTCHRDKADLILDHMVQNIICPEFFNHELYDAKALAAAQTAAATDADTVLWEHAHRMAYRGTGLGRSLFYNPGNSGNLERDVFLDFAAENFKDANNIALVGLGMDSETVAGLADEYLWSLEGGAGVSGPCTWTGRQEVQLEAPGAGTKVLYLTEGAAAGSNDAIVLGLIQSIIGASSASSIAHGTILSKLTQAAAPYTSKPFAAQCVNVNYSDTGIFGLCVSADGAEIGDVLKASVGVVHNLTGGVSDEALEVAKNKYKLSLLLERESPSSLMGSIGSETLAAGSPSTSSALCGAVDAISAGDVIEMAKKLVNAAPILVSHGNTEHMPLMRDL